MEGRNGEQATTCYLSGCNFNIQLVATCACDVVNNYGILIKLRFVWKRWNGVFCFLIDPFTDLIDMELYWPRSFTCSYLQCSACSNLQCSA